ncbi:MAG: T9SS type A sorting domain-containing protein, partial [Candidatus Hydrothermia bacterium]
RSLYSYTYYYTNSPVAREQDRERSLLWFLWVSEKVPDGEEFIKEIAFNDDFLARYQITEKLAADLGLNMPDAFTLFGLTCALNNYNVSGYTFSSLPGYKIFTGQKSVSSPQRIKENGQVIYVPFKKAGALALDTYFKGQEGNKMVISGDTVPGFRVFVFDTTNKSITDYTGELDSINRVILPQISGKHNIYVVNINSSTYYFWMGPGVNDPAPQIIGLYSIQNPAFLKTADIYLASKDLLYSDASPGDTTPKIVLEPSDPKYKSAIYKLSTFLTNDTVYHGTTLKRLYTGGVSLELKDQFGNVFSGDVYVKLYRAMNRLGMEVSNPQTDTLGLIHIYGAGTYSLIGGNVILDIPQGALANGTLVLVDRADAGLALADGSEGTAFQIGTRSIPVMKPFMLRLATDGPTGLYYKNGDQWEPVQTYMSPDNSYLVAHLDKMGTYLMGRPGAPKVTVPELWAPTAIREGEARIYLSLPSASKVSWSVYDVSGKRVAQPYDGTLDQGSYVLTWNTANTPSGIYFYRIAVNDETHLRKVAFIGR